MFPRRAFVLSKRPAAYYQSEPYLNFLDPKEKSFLGQKYVRAAHLDSVVDRPDTIVQEFKRGNNSDL